MLTQRSDIRRSDIVSFNKVSFKATWLVCSIKCNGKQASADTKYLNDPSSFLLCNKSVLSRTALCVTHDSRLVGQFQASDKTLSNRKAVLTLHVLGEEMSVN